MVFDIRLATEETDGYVNFHLPVLAPLPIKPVTLTMAGIPTQTGLEMREVGVDLCILKYMIQLQLHLQLQLLYWLDSVCRV